jgi:heme o synthase
MKPPPDLANLPDGSLVLPGPLSTTGLKARLTDFYELTKPRMNFLVVVTTMVGFYMAAHVYEWGLVVATLVGTALTAASASVFNQLLERDYDALMPRTRNRPLPGDRVTNTEAALWGLVLGAAGVASLAMFVNLLTATLGLLTLLLYVFIYTPMKRSTSLCTIVGAVPGAIPPMMGWTAYHNALSLEALILFAILFIWQMPHFLAIAVLYKDDYAQGGFKMLPCVDDADLSMTSRQILVYLIAMFPVSLAPSWFGMTGWVYQVAALLLGLVFFAYGVRVAQTRTRADARKLFFVSIIYLPLLLAVMMLDRI